MATITVETGSIVANANSYVSEATLETYASDRNITLSGDSNDLLIRAMDWIESQMFRGSKYSSAQALQWPRYGVTLDGFDVGTDEIPQLLKDALCEAAISIDAGSTALADVGRSTRREKVGEIEVEYMNGASDVTYMTAAETKLRKLLVGSGSRISAAAFRG